MVHFELPVFKGSAVLVLTKRRQVIALPSRHQIDLKINDRIVVVADSKTVAKFRPGRVGILRRTDSWLRLTDIPLFQPANMRT